MRLRHNQNRAVLLSAAVILGLLACSPARADDAPPKTTVSGILDFYYMYNMNHPRVGALAGGRAFDVKNDSFSFSLLKVDVVKPVGKGSPVGFTLTGTVGKTADIVHSTEPGGMNTYKYLQQVYGTYVVGNGKMPITVDFGKFVTWHGYEVIGSTSNDNYSGSLLFTFAIPFYHAGIRATIPLSDKLTAGLYLVNGWNDVEDSNGGKSYGASLAFTPSKPLSLTLNYLGGDEGSMTANGVGSFGGIGFPTPLILNTQLVDLVAVWTPTAKIKLGANVDYASAAKSGAADGNWSGEAVYFKYQFKPSTYLCLRAEHFEDNNGLRTGAAQNVNEITVTLDHAWKANLVTRLEFRHDHAGAAGFFPSGGGGSRDQDTISLSHVVKF